MNLRLLPVAVFLMLANVAAAQTTNEKADSGLAHSRVIAARKLVPVTAHQCLADLSSWESRDTTNEKARIEQSTWWYQKLSTEELVRLSSESVACGSLLHHDHRHEVELMRLYDLSFTSQLLYRAEAILVEKQLMNDYLLRTSQ